VSEVIDYHRRTSRRQALCEHLPDPTAGADYAYQGTGAVRTLAFLIFVITILMLHR